MKKIFFISFLVLFLAFLVPDITQAEGLVPCGGERQPECTICYFFVLFNNIIKFVMFKLVPPIAALMLVVGGIMFFFAGASPGMLNRAKSIIISVAIGLGIIFGAWVIVNTVLVQSEIVDPGKGKALLEWWKITCGEEGAPSNGKPANTSPAADAGSDQEVNEGDSIILDGSGSDDPDGTITNHSWFCSNNGLDFNLSGEKPEFTAPLVDADTIYTCTLTVTDDQGAKDTDDVKIKIKNKATEENNPPVADANGPYVGDPENLTIIFDGSASFDPDGDTLSYQWDFGDGSQGSGVSPSHAYPDETKAYTVTLTVSDGELEHTDSTTVQITGSGPPTPF